MKRKIKKFLIAALATMAIGCTAVACSTGSDSKNEKGNEYSYNYYAPLRTECDSFMTIDGKLDEEIWKGQNYLYWVGGKNNSMKATTVFTSKGLYVGMWAEDGNVTWTNRYALTSNSRFAIQVVKEDEINYNNGTNVHPTQVYKFVIDAKNSLSYGERRYDAASYYEGTLNGNTSCFSAELFLPWSEMGYEKTELNEDGMPNGVKLLIQYRSPSDYGGFPGFSDDNSFKTYYTYDENGSTCEFDKDSETDTLGYSVNGWTPGDRWNVDQKSKTATNTVDRTQILWFRKDVDGNEISTATNYIASVKVKAIQAQNQYPFVGVMTLKAKTLFNIYGVETYSLSQGTVKVAGSRETNGGQWVSSKLFSSTSNGYTGNSQLDCDSDEVYLTVIKRDTALFYFINGSYVGMEYDERLEGECVIGIFANGQTTVSDWQIEDYSGKVDDLNTYLNQYVYFITETDDGGGYVTLEKDVAKHNESVGIQITPKSGYILKSLNINDESKLDDFLLNADDSAKYNIKVTKNLNIEVSFEAIPKSSLKNIFFEIYGEDDKKITDAVYTIRGNDKRLFYTGNANRGNIVGSLLKAGTHPIGVQSSLLIDGNYTIEITADGYAPTVYEFNIPENFEQSEYYAKITLNAYPYGSVTVNGKTAKTSGKNVFGYESAESNSYSSEPSFSGMNIQYLKNTKFTGDYLFNGKIQLKEDALYAVGSEGNNWKCGSVVGYTLSSGGNYFELKTAAWISGKLYVNYNNSVEIGLTGFSVKGSDTSTVFKKSGQYVEFSVVRHDDVIYVYNVDGDLCFTLSKDGITCYNSAICEGESKLDKFNSGVKAFFNDGNENVFGLYNVRSSEGGGKYLYTYSYTKDKDKISEKIKATNFDYMYAASTVTVNGTTITGTEKSVKYDPESKKYTYVASANDKVSFVTSNTDKKAIVTTGDYVVRVKMSTDKESDFRIYAGNNKYFIIRTGVKNDNSIFFRMANGDGSIGWSSELLVGGVDYTSIFANPANRNDSNGVLDLTIVRYGNKIYVYACDYLDENGVAKKHSTWKLIWSFDSSSAQTADNLQFRSKNNQDADTCKNSYISAAEDFFTAGEENAFAMVKTNATSASWIVEVNDDDNAAKNFVESPQNVD